MTELFAFLHHVAAFALVAALAVEFVLIRDELSFKNARRLLVADLAFGISALAVLIIGFVRVVYLEKGAFYYFHSVPFLAKLALFVLVALISIYPTREFLSWRRPLRHGELPVVSARKMRLIRSLIHWELAGIVVLILNAVLMARGIAYVG